MLSRCIFVKLKKITTYSFSVWLALCVLLAPVGVPVFAHSCLMDADCLEVSVIPPQSCCSDGEAENNDAGNCIESEECCKDELSFFKTDLPAIKTISADFLFGAITALPVISFSFSNFINRAVQHIRLPQQNAPPLSGKSLLILIQVFRI